MFEFYRLPDVAFYGESFDFVLDPSYDGATFACDNYVQDGLYELWCDVDGIEFCAGEISVVFEYDPHFYAYFYETLVDASVNVDDTVIPVTVRLGLVYPETDFVCVVGVCEVSIPGEDPYSVDSFRLIPVPYAPSVSDVVTPEMVSGVLDNVVTLIPVVVGGLAIFVGIRKGLAWLDNLIHGV